MNREQNFANQSALALYAQWKSGRKVGRSSKVRFAIANNPPGTRTNGSSMSVGLYR